MLKRRLSAWNGKFPLIITAMCSDVDVVLLLYSFEEGHLLPVYHLSVCERLLLVLCSVESTFEIPCLFTCSKSIASETVFLILFQIRPSLEVIKIRVSLFCMRNFITEGFLQRSQLFMQLIFG